MRAMHALFLLKKESKMDCIPEAIIRAGLGRLINLRSVSETTSAGLLPEGSNNVQVGR
jgi:hypothetical protein